MGIVHVFAVFAPHHDFDGESRLVHFVRVLRVLHRFLENRLDFLQDGIGNALGARDPPAGRHDDGGISLFDSGGNIGVELEPLLVHHDKGTDPPALHP